MTTSSRLALLRAEMKRRNLAAVLVPRGDEFQNEYVPACAERLKWLTGFTGSAGLAVVLPDRAALFTDGRYALQAPAEIDTALFEVVLAPPHNPASWLAALVRPGNRVGYDPWLHPDAWVANLKVQLERAGAVAVAVPGNLIDAVWADRPPPPVAKAEIHPFEFAGETSAAKRARLAAGLAAQGLDAFALTAVDSVMWLLNVRGADLPHTPFALSYAILHGTGEVEWFIDPAKVDADLRRHLGDAVQVRPIAEFASVLAALTGKKVAADASLTPAAVFAAIGPDALRRTDPCQLPKAAKNAIEIEGARRAHRRDGVALVTFLAWLDAQAPGTVDELQVMAKLHELRAQGEHFRDLSFATIAGSGPNGAIVHYHATAATNRRLQAGELLLLDSGGQYTDGTTDVTRTVAIGASGPEMAERFTRVLQGHINLAMASFPPGVTGAQLDALARAPLWAMGLDFDHGTGHGVGSYLSVHEGPQRINARPNEVALLPGMIVSNEPGYYKAGHYGIRIENLVTVVLHEGLERPMLKFETLTLCPLDRRLIDEALLTGPAREWLNGYHEQVRAQLAPLVTEDVAAWLQQATAPL